ncbi:hypothetical protein [Celeribacter sp.]|uniref:hypothetical protein n=1 Tax=Celeribacter sp. TaxID=1890673 RepID=UPI003A90D86B
MNDTTLTQDIPAAEAPVDAHDEEASISPKGVAAVLAVIVLVIAAVAVGIATFGWPVLGLTALAAVPVIYLCLILLTVGK